jgi:RNA polymerase sigma-70 factor (ECF subfamily)
VDGPLSDKELVEFARGGDGDAIALLVNRYSPRLHRYLTRMVGRPEQAEDRLQDTWLRVMEKLDSFRADRPFAPWLYAVARNRAIDILRRQARQGHKEPHYPADDGTFTDPLNRVADPAPSTLEDLSERDLLGHVQKTLAALPAELREVLSLRFEAQLRLDDIARTLDLPSSTVKSRLYRGLEQLRLRVEELR